MAVDTDLLTSLETEHKLPAGLLSAVMATESGGDANAVSPKGARGHFQFMPDTATAYGVTDPTDFNQTAPAAARYLSDLNSRYAGDWTKTLAAYNAGPTAVAKYNGVPPYPETQAYVQKVMGKLVQPDEDTPPDISDLPPDISDLGTGPSIWGGEANKRPAPRDYSKEMDENAGVIEPIVGGIAGGLAGGAIGTGAAPGVGTAVGTALGGGIGTFLGTMAGISRAESNGSLTPIPVEQKLLYAAKQSGIDMAATVATIGVGKMLTVLKPFFKPSEMDEVERFFRNQGLENPRPQLGPMADYSTASYKSAAADMKTAVNSAIQDVASDQAGIMGSPTQAGSTFKTAFSAAQDKVSQYVDNLYGFSRRGTAVGDTMVYPATTSTAGPTQPGLVKFAKDALTEFKAQNTLGSLDGATQKTLQMVADGKPVSIADLISMKRGVAQAADFVSPDGVTRALDDKTQKALLGGLDATILDAMKPYPKASGAYQAANKVYSDAMSDLRSGLMLQTVKKDPLSVTDFVAQKASPEVMNDFEAGLGRMMRTGALTLDQANQLRAGVRQAWITRNIGSADKAADLADALSTKTNDPALVETFNYVMRGAPQAQAAVESAARAASAARKFTADIPDPARAGAGAYAMSATAGGYLGNMMAGPAGGAVGSLAAMGVTRMMTSTIPKALAKAAMNNDAALLNQIRVATSWYTAMAARGQPVSTIPGGVMDAINSIESSMNGGQ